MSRRSQLHNNASHSAEPSKSSQFQPRSFGDESDAEMERSPSNDQQQGHDFSQISVLPKATTIQPKLTIGEPNDQYEQEADRVAEQVMSMDSASAPQGTVPAAGLQMKPLASSIQRLTESEEEPLEAQDKLSQQALESQLNQSKGSGAPLPDDVRAFMEPRFGADFSQVRVHTGSEAVQMNQELRAQAFTYGSDIYYGAGKTPGKDELTGHELTHVVQQNGAQLQKKESDEPKEGNLPDPVQAKMEKAFNADFSDVKVHEHSASAKSFGAIAYTQGNEIHFASGYNPHSSQDQEYLGHELSHVLQQRAGAVQGTHVENGHEVSDDASLESQAHEEGRKAAQGESVSHETTSKQSSRPPSVQKKSQPIQMWRDVPGQIQVESTAPDTAAAWGVFMSAARKSAGGLADTAEPELRRQFYGAISQNLRGTFQPIDIEAHTTSGFNMHWMGSIRFVFGDQETPMTGGGTGTTTLGGASGSSSSTQTSSSTTTGSSGSGQGSYTPGQSGGGGGNASVGGTGSTTTGLQGTQGSTQTAGASSQVSQQLERFSSGIGIEVNITAEYDMGSSWTDWINPATYGAWAGDALTSRSGSSTGSCGTVVYFKGAGINGAPPAK